MANINAALPTAIAIPFHPPTEALQHDNLIKPVIPKTEIIGSYTKLRDDQDRSQVSDQARTILQDENETHSDSEDQQQQQSNAEKRRLNFFANRREVGAEYEDKALQINNDFQLALSVIQEKYNNAVTPIPDPTINYLL
jgi:hypothetical protein